MESMIYTDWNFYTGNNKKRTCIECKRVVISKDVLIDYIIQLVIFGGDDVAIDRKRSIIEVATKSFQRSAIKQQRWIK